MRKTTVKRNSNWNLIISININWHAFDCDLFAELLYNLIYNKELITEMEPNLEKI